MDKLLINVPSVEELEEGHTNYISLGSEAFDISNASGQSDAVYEPISSMLIARPNPYNDIRDDSLVLAGWTGSTIAIMDRPETGKGIQSVVGSFTIESVDPIIEYNRGFFLDFSFYQPISQDETDPVVIYWGTMDKTNDAYKWMLLISTNEKGAASAAVYELDPTTVTASTVDRVYTKSADFTLCVKDFYNNQHRIWIEPLTQQRMLIRNAVLPMGTVVRQQYESKALEVENEDIHSGRKYDIVTPYYSSKFKIESPYMGWFVLRNLEYYHNMEVYSKSYIDLGYTSTQEMETRFRWYAPDGFGDQTSWTSSLTILNQDQDLWTGNHGDSYWWSFSITAPTTGTLTGYSKLGAKVSDLKFRLDPLVVSNSLATIDILTDPRFCLVSLEEDRVVNDWESTMNFSVSGLLSDFNDINWPRANARVQWWIDNSGDLVRFDGIIDEIGSEKVVDFTAGDYRATFNIKCKTRWRDAEFSIFSGSYVLDGMYRSDVYNLLARQMGLDPTEVSIATLVNDTTLPQADYGKKTPSLMTKIGSSVLDVFKEVQNLYSVEDRLYFRDDGTTQVKLFITNPDEILKTTFYRTALEAGASYPVIASNGGGSPMRQQITDKEFYNDFWVIGGDAEYNPEDVFVCNMRYPPSWQDPTDRLYIRRRRVMIAINPAWNTQGIVNAVCYGLFTKYCRFTCPWEISSFLVPGLYPNDIVTVDPGEEPDAVATDCRITAMKTTLMGTDRPLNRRYATMYNLEIL